jgi:hypothetical protein
MTNDVWLPLLTEHGPMALLVFYLLWRDTEKDKATRAVLDKNTVVLAEMSTILKERLPRSGD